MKYYKKAISLFLLMMIVTLVPVSNVNAASKASKVVKKARLNFTMIEIITPSLYLPGRKLKVK